MRPHKSPVHVIAGVIRNSDGEVLLAQRPAHAHLGGLWEFPGGKLERNEERLEGLKRELHEELGIDVLDARPLIRVPYDYPGKSILLDVWEVLQFTGEVKGLEGQALTWVAPRLLHAWPMPAADRPVVTAIALPDRYLITPEPGADHAAFLDGLCRALSTGIRLVQFRAKELDDRRYEMLAKRVLGICEEHESYLLLNHDPEMVIRIGAHGVHLTALRLEDLRERPLGAQYLVAASCHHRDELLKAQALGLDFAVLGPVKTTLTHPATIPLGWRKFEEWVERISLPVYALGGMSELDLETSRRLGGRGIAAIRSLWV